MPCLSAQFCDEPDTFTDNMMDVRDAYRMLFEGMAKIACGEVNLCDTRIFAMRSITAVDFLLPPPPRPS